MAAPEQAYDLRYGCAGICFGDAAAIGPVSTRVHVSNIQPASSVPAPTPYTSTFVRARGVSLHCLDFGAAGGTPMLCVHGGAAHAHWFDFVASGFTADYHVMSLDLRGHGDSAWADPPAYSFERYASDIAAFTDVLDLKDFVLIGHS